MKKLLITGLICAVSLIVADARPRAATAAGKVTITITNFNFTPKTITVAPGTTVVWYNKEGRHSVESDNGTFKSDTLAADKSYEFTFAKAGRYPYHCEFHGEMGGKDMAGVVIVK
jgi:plastocyanin